MWFFSRKSEVDALKKLNSSLALSFSHVRQDTGRIFQWLQFLNQKLEANEQQLFLHSQQIQDIFRRFELVPSSSQQLKSLVDDYYSKHDSTSRIEELKARIDRLIALQAPAFDQINALRQRIEAIEQRQRPRQSFKEKIIQKISKSSKEYVKNLVLSYIRKYEKIAALKLREMVVEEQGLCSKSSFYRILDEVEHSDEVEVIQEGKQKYYFSSLHKSIQK